MKIKLALALCGLLASPCGVIQAETLGPAISYQGRLDDSGNPANGTYSFRFRLLSDAAGATQVGPVVDMPSQPVASGLLNASLDFGLGAFNNEARWLEISVKPGGPGAAAEYIKLNPQPLPPGGSSQFARVAGDVLNGVITGAKLAPLAITTTHISDGAITAPKLGPASITSGSVADGAITAAKIASGQVVKSLNVNGNLLRESVALAAGANVTLTPSGNTVTISSSGIGGSGIWTALNGNTYYNGGNVGIGTTAPTAPLHVNSGATASSILAALLEPSLVGGGFNQIYLGRTPTGNGCSTFTYNYDDATPVQSFLSLGLYNSSFTLNVRGDGNVGIGTTAPQEKLHVNGAYLRVEGTGGEAAYIGGDGQGADVQVGSLNPSVKEVVLWNAGDNSHMNLTANHGSFLGNLYYGGLQTKLDVADTFTATIRAADFWFGHSSRHGAPGRALVDGNTALHLNFNSDWANTIIGGNNVSVCTLTIRGGCDLAEPFPMKEVSIEKGSVVVIDEDHPGRLKRSTRAYDTRVAGIVSGANGINPGIALKQEGALDQGENVALTGRVYVQADAARGAIKPGDLLTTSDTPGHAMKVGDHTKSQGAILGKAMTSLKDGKGLVLVLVTLQ